VREQILDLHVSLPPAAVAERLLAAAAHTPRVHGEAFEVTVSHEEVRISPPPGDYERPRAVCIGSLVAEGSGSRLRLQDADLSAGSRGLLWVINGVGAGIAVLVAVNDLSQGKLGGLWGALGMVGFLLMTSMLVAFVTTGSAGDDVRSFVRRALDEAR
jgi:hypothetical protein